MGALVEGLDTGEATAELVDGLPALRLAGESVTVAYMIAALRERGRCDDVPAPLCFEPEVLERHGRATLAEDGYLVCAGGSHDARDRGRRADTEVAPDAMSLRLYTSPFCSALNALLRARPDRPAELLAVVEGLRGAATCDLARRDLRADDPCFRRLRRLCRLLEGLELLDDPRLPRVLGEMIVHASLAIAALERQRPFTRSLDDPEHSSAWLYGVCELPADQLAELREAVVEPRRSWFDSGLLSVALDPQPRQQHGHTCTPCEIEIRPLYRSSAGRWLDDVVSDERKVVFPPGVRFAVLDFEERGSNGHTRIRLAERSRLAARWAERLPAPEIGDRPIYHYTLGRALPSIVDDGEIGVAAALPGTCAPTVWLSTHDDWEPSVVKSVTEDGARRALSEAELAEHCGGLFRIRVDPVVGALSWAHFADMVGVAPSLIELLDDRGRERGADPSEWYCCPWSVPRARWRSVEMRHDEFGWVPLEM